MFEVTETEISAYIKQADRIKKIPLKPIKEPRPYEDSFYAIPVPADLEEDVVKHVEDAGYKVKGTGEGNIIVFDEDEAKEVNLFLRNFLPVTASVKKADGAIQSGIDENLPIVVSGVKGVNRNEFTKTFPNFKAYLRWREKNEGDVSNLYIRNE